MIDLTQIVEAVIALAVAIVTGLLIPLLRQRLTVGQQEKLDAVLEVAVMAAEQMYGAGMGKEKLQSAIDYLHGKGYDVDVEQIEAAVWSCINHRKLSEAESVLMLEDVTKNDAVKESESGK